LYVFSTAGNISTPLIHYTHLQLTQSFDSLWIAGNSFKKFKTLGDKAAQSYINQDKDPLFFINIIISDFNKKKPDLVFVSTMNNIDYLHFLLLSSAFKNIWNQYDYLNTINIPQENTKIIVYQRKPDVV
jgi:hypothetical protein